LDGYCIGAILILAFKGRSGFDTSVHAFEIAAVLVLIGYLLPVRERKGDDQPLLWTDPLRVVNFFKSKRFTARRVVRRGTSSVMQLDMMDYDNDKIDEAVLALLYLGLHDQSEHGAGHGKVLTGKP
jgi:hypothetical protein